MATGLQIRKFREARERLKALTKTFKRDGLLIGQELLNIREGDLWEAEFESWTAYLSYEVWKTFGIDPTNAGKLVQAYQISRKLADNCRQDFEPRAMNEIGRLAPDKPSTSGRGGTEKDYAALPQRKIDRVVKRSQAEAKAQGKATPTAKIVRAEVDRELGIDRSAAHKETQRIQAESEKLRIANREAERLQAEWEAELGNYLEERIRVITEIIKNVAKVPAEGWEYLETTNSTVCKRLAAKCDELSELIKS